MDANDKYVFSFFAKQNGRSILKIHEATIDSAEFATFDLANGTTSFVDGSGFTCYGSFIEAYPNDWYRCSVICSTPSLLTNEPFITNVRLNNGSTSNYTGDGVSGIYITGLNVVKSDILTEYIPNLTTGTSTRAADVIDGAEADFNDATGVIELDVQALANSGTDRSISLNNGTSAERLEFRFSTSDNLIEFYSVHLSVATGLTYTVKDATEMNNVKALYDGTSFKLKINDVQVAQRDDREIATGLSICDFKIGASTNLFEGHLRQLNVYDDTSAFASTATTFNAMATTAKYDLK